VAEAEAGRPCLESERSSKRRKGALRSPEASIDSKAADDDEAGTDDDEDTLFRETVGYSVLDRHRAVEGGVAG
jgi:hypothetical protein